MSRISIECPKSPNCVSTLTNQADKHMPPIPCSIDPIRVAGLIKNLMSEVKRCELIEENSNYLHFLITSSFLRFKDDVEFYIDQENQLIHFRSASRVGYSDLGVNRKRMTQLSQLITTRIEDLASANPQREGAE